MIPSTNPLDEMVDELMKSDKVQIEDMLRLIYAHEQFVTSEIFMVY